MADVKSALLVHQDCSCPGDPLELTNRILQMTDVIMQTAILNQMNVGVCSANLMVSLLLAAHSVAYHSSAHVSLEDDDAKIDAALRLVREKRAAMMEIAREEDAMRESMSHPYKH